MKAKIKFIENELRDLDVEKGSEAYDYIYNQAVAAADILTKKELKQLIEDHLESFSFEQRQAI